jgi:HK97 family phage major capsid protein
MTTAEKLIRQRASRALTAAEAVLSPDGRATDMSAELLRGLSNHRQFQHHGGIMVPTEWFASLTATGATAGEELTFTVPGAFGAARRPAPVIARAGGRLIPGADNIRVARLATGFSPSWLANGETSALPVDEEDVVIRGESPSPGMGMVAMAWSRRLDVQSNPAVAALVDDDIHAAVAALIDAAVIAGTGEDGQPAGLLSRELEEIDLEAAAPTYSNLTEAEALVGDANAGDDLAWVTSGRGRQALRLCPVLNNAAAGPAWIRNTVLDHPAFASSHVADPAIILGAWRNVVVGLHSVELLLDPTTGVRQGLIRGTAFALISVALIHPEAFVVLSDGLFPAAAEE